MQFVANERLEKLYIFSTAPLCTLVTAKAHCTQPSEGFIYGSLAENLSEQVFRCLIDFTLSSEEESGENLRTDWYNLVSGELIIKWFVRGLL